MDTPMPDLGDATIKAKPAVAKSFASGRYVVKRVLGEGGQKIVHLVHDEALDRDCALSLIKADVLEPDDLNRLRREAQAMARLGAHPNLVTVFDIGEEDGSPYLLSEYVPGGDLRSELQGAGGPLSIERTLVIAADLATALAVAHQQGIIHRDLKPANIWLTADGGAKIGDFGLAIAIGSARMTSAGMIVGTPTYLSPEQALGGEVGASCDLYSLGVVLYEMVTGRPPFLGDDLVAVISQHISTPAVAPSWHNPEVPRALERLIMSLLGKAPAERPESAAAVRDAIKAIAATASESLAGTVQAPLNPLDRLAGGVFVGREKETVELRRNLEDAISGSGQLILLAGEPGIGKTRMADELCTYAQLRGAEVLVGRCYEGEGAPVFWPWVQVVRAYLRDRDQAELTSDMGAGAADIAQVVSEVRDRLPSLLESPALEPEQARFRLFDGITAFLKKASERRPLVLVLDDLHRADKASLLLLQFLTREMRQSRLLVIGTYRDIEVDRQHPLTSTLAELTREAHFTRVFLQGLTRDDVARFIEMSAGVIAPVALADVVYRESEGNPFFMSEVVRLLTADGRLARPNEIHEWTIEVPQSVREVIGRRLESLSAECNTVLTLASVVGREFDLSILERISDVSGDRLLDALEEAEAARLIAEVPSSFGRYSFSHALILETVYEELSATRRTRYHLRLGEVLEEAMPGEPEAIAHHFLNAAGVPEEKTRRYLVLAGEKAAASAAWEEAAGYYQRALEFGKGLPEHERADLYRRLGLAQSGAGDWEGAVAGLNEALSLLEQLGEREQAGWIGYSLRRLYGARGQFAEASAVVQRSLTFLGDADSEIRSRLLAQAGFFSGAFGNTEEADRLLDESMAIAERLENPAAIGFAHYTRGIHHLGYSQLSESVEALAKGAEFSLKANDLWTASLSSSFRRRMLLTLGDVTKAEESMEEEEQLARRAGNFLAVCEAKWLSSLIATLRGQLQRAEELAEELIRLIEAARADSGLPGALINLAYIRFLRGGDDYEPRLLRAIEVYDRMASAPTDDPRPVLCYLRCLAGETEAAATMMPAMDRYFDMEQPWTAGLGEARLTLASALAVMGDREHASALYRPLKEWTAQSQYVLTGVASIPQLVSRVLGMVAGACGDANETVEQFETALRLARDIALPTEVAETCFWYGRFLADETGSDRMQQASRLLSEAREIWQNLGMVERLNRSVS